jgi:hypothetical protein
MGESMLLYKGEVLDDTASWLAGWLTEMWSLNHETVLLSHVPKRTCKPTYAKATMN